MNNRNRLFKILTAAEGVVILALIIVVVILAGKGGNTKQQADNSQNQIETAQNNTGKPSDTDSKDSGEPSAAGPDDPAEPADPAAADDGTYKADDRWENYSKSYDEWKGETLGELMKLNNLYFPVLSPNLAPFLNRYCFYDKVVENEDNCLRLIYLNDRRDYFELVFCLENKSGNFAYMGTDILSAVIGSIRIVIDSDNCIQSKSFGNWYEYNESSIKFSVAINKGGLEATNDMKLVFTNDNGRGVDKVIDLIADRYMADNYNNPNNTDVVIRTLFDMHPEEFPQIDSSTARKPITAAIFSHFISAGDEKRAEKYADLSPWCNKTHGAWLNLADRTADLVFLVMPTEEERQYLADRNVPVEIKPYGADGLAIILNPDAPVKSFTVDQIRGIYEGKITNWKELGGEDHPINPLYRNEQSGSQRMFEEFIWPEGNVPDFSSFNTIDSVMGSYEEYGDMESVTIQIFTDPYAIGYNIVSYVKNEFTPGYVDFAEIDGIYPDTDSFTDGSYPFTTTAYVAIRADEPEYSPARRLFKWLDTTEFNEICRSNSSLSVFRYKQTEIYDFVNPLTDVEEIIDCMLCDHSIAYKCDLQALSDADLAILRNTVYAKYGKSFTKQEYRDYFSEFWWYNEDSEGLTDDRIYQLFTKTDKENLSLIVAEEQRRKNALR